MVLIMNKYKSRKLNKIYLRIYNNYINKGLSKQRADRLASRYIKRMKGNKI